MRTQDLPDSKNISGGVAVAVNYMKLSLEPRKYVRVVTKTDGFKCLGRLRGLSNQSQAPIQIQLNRKEAKNEQPTILHTK